GPAEQGGGPPQAEAGDEVRVDEEADEIERVERARVRRGEERRKAQAQHAAEAERGQRDAEDAADEAAAEARVVAERALGWLAVGIRRAVTAAPGRPEPLRGSGGRA